MVVVASCFASLAASLMITAILFLLVFDFFGLHFLVLTEDEDGWMCGSGDFLLGRATFVTRLDRHLPMSLSSCSDSDDVSSVAIVCTYASRSFSCSTSLTQVVQALVRALT